jgi:hypothetical protein
MNSSRIYVALFVGAISLFAGCKTKSLRRDQFVGLWRPDTGGRTPLGTASVATTLTLDHDGTFVASSLPPGFLQPDDVKPNQMLSGSGTWSLSERGGETEERLRLTFTSVAGSAGRNLPYGAELFIQKSGTEPRLFYFKGDPDENQEVVFRRDSTR